MHTQGCDSDTMRNGVAITHRVCIIFVSYSVNYCGYTSVATHQDIDQIIYF